MTNTRWPPELESTLRTLVAQGHTWSEIAEKLHLSRSNISGKASRLGLKSQSSLVQRQRRKPTAKVDLIAVVSRPNLVLTGRETAAEVIALLAAERARQPTNLSHERQLARMEPSVVYNAYQRSYMRDWRAKRLAAGAAA